MQFLPLLAAATLATLATSASLQAQDPTSFEVGALKFNRPDAWSWVPVTSPMRKAQLKITGKEKGQVADVTFFHFGAGAGGGVDANAKRWLGQFESKEGASKVDPQDIGGVKVTLVTTQGTFHSGMPGGPLEAIADYALLGAIIENPEGDIFIKMTGPAGLVNEQRKAFLDFIASAVAARK